MTTVNRKSSETCLGRDRASKLVAVHCVNSDKKEESELAAYPKQIHVCVLVPSKFSSDLIFPISVGMRPEK
jgi:hypothetical protein